MKRAFTLIELLVVVAIIALLAGMLLPSLNRARGKADQAVCIGNLKQLQVAWQLYTDDHGGQYPENYSEYIGSLWRSSFNSWCGPSSAPEDKDTKALSLGTFGRMGYIKADPTYHCPGDARSRTRSYSMNGNFGGRSEEIQTVLNREKVVNNPVGLFVFIEEHEGSIDDGHFLVWSAPDPRWINMPSGRHNQIGVLSFADGHVESWKWKTPKTFEREKTVYWKNSKAGPDLDDLRRLQSVIIPSTIKPEERIP